ncbi:glycerophosphodiester phosphodiesterase family protein, partial [Clostridium sporogenes]
MKYTKILAHRGASAYAPENTMAAFKKAIEMNADGI